MLKNVHALSVVAVGVGWLASSASAGTWSPTVYLNGGNSVDWSSDFGPDPGQALFSGMTHVPSGTYSSSLTAYGPGSLYATTTVTYPTAGSASQSNPIVVQVHNELMNFSGGAGFQANADGRLIATLSEPGSNVHFYVGWSYTYQLIGGSHGRATLGNHVATVGNFLPRPTGVLSVGTVSGSFTGVTTNGVLDFYWADWYYQGQSYAGHGILDITYHIFADTVPVVPAPSAGLAMLAGLGIVSRRRR